MIKTLTTFLTISCISIIMLLSGCSYDNSLYNAKKYFVSAQNRPLNQSGKPAPQAVDEYNKTIQKCGYILTERKNSREADDALFLLAKALYYRGNSPYQAKDQFQSLLNNFPNSPFAPDATLYLAKVHRQINEPTQAENILSSYLLNPAKAKSHPKALLLLADFAIEDKNGKKAQFWLEKILTQYQKSIYAKEATFLLGKHLFETQDYENSLIQFTKVVGTRSLDRNVKNDARYYVALNQLYLNQTQKSLSTINKLNKIEERLDKIPAIRVLLGRVLLNLQKESDAIELLQNTIKLNPRSLASAEAYFWLAEYYYYRKGDVQSALDNYNKVKLELATSTYVTPASTKQDALTLIKQINTVNVVENPQHFVDKYLEISDSYLNVLSQPDSARVIFNKIYATPLIIQSKIDSLTLVRDSLKINLDSLSLMADSINVNKDFPVDIKALASNADTLITIESETNLDRDSLEVLHELSDTTIPDSLAISDKVENKNIDETQAGQQKPSITNDNRLSQVQTDYDRIQNNLTALDEILENFKSELVPYSKFVQAAMLYRNNNEDPLLQSIYTELETQYPKNKYTQATKLLLEGKTVRLVDSELEREEELIDFACANILSEPDSSVTALQELTQSTYQNICTQANFRLGWFYTFEQQDTIKAKPFLNEIAKLENTNEYYQLMKRFYNGTKYTINFAQDDTLSQILSLPDSLSVNSNGDSLATKSPADTTEIKANAPADSLSNPIISEPILPEEKKNDDIQPEIFKPEDRLFIKPD